MKTAITGYFVMLALFVAAVNTAAANGLITSDVQGKHPLTIAQVWSFR